MDAVGGDQFDRVKPSRLADRPEIEGEKSIRRRRNILKHTDVRGIGCSGIRENIEKRQQRVAIHVYVEDALVVRSIA